MRFKQVYSSVWVVVVLAAFLFVGNAFAGGGPEGGPVDLQGGVITGPEAWAAVIIQCQQGQTWAKVYLRAKRIDDCNVMTDTLIVDENLAFDNVNTSCPTEEGQLSNMFLYFSFNSAPGVPNLFGDITWPVLTKIKNPLVEVDSGSGMTTVSFDAQLKNYTPNN